MLKVIADAIEAATPEPEPDAAERLAAALDARGCHSDCRGGVEQLREAMREAKVGLIEEGE
jgi:hypothetical protein